MNAQTIAMEMIAYLAAAMVAVPVAHRLGLGSVLGYLLAGVIIGPFVLGWVGHFSSDVMTISEFGVVMMLFLVGLELDPRTLWRMRGIIVGLGGVQVILTTLVLALPALALGLSLPMAVAAGLILALSSTAVVLPSLQETGLVQTPGGRACFGVLLSQDIAVIPILALLPLLSTLHPAAAMREEAAPLAAVSPVMRTLLVVGAVAGIILGGRYLVRPFFRFIATTHLQELFTATALLIVIGIVLLMDQVGIDPALGAFLGGVVLADSEFRHQIEADIAPFKGLLLGIFFVAVGAGINFSYFLQQPWLVLGIVAGLIVLKFVVLWGLGWAFRLDASSSLLFAFALAQGDEFAFVLFPSSVAMGVLSAAWSNILVLAVALSMALTPFLLLIDRRWVQPRFAVRRAEREADVVEEPSPVLLVGFGRFGNVVGRLMKANGIAVTILDFDAEQIDTMSRLGFKAYYGDATRLDILRTAGAGQARLLLVMVDNDESILRIVDLAKEHFPHLKIIARARDRSHAYQLVKREVPRIYHELVGSAVDFSVGVLEELGYAPERAEAIAQIFRRHEHESIRALAESEGQDGYFSRAREQIARLEEAVAALPELPRNDPPA